MPHFFISYRRSDREGRILAHTIFRELRRRYGDQSAFLDVDSRSPGLSFPAKVNQALNVTDVVLVIIGPAWLQILTERLEDSRDWVRYEVAESLKRSGLPVVPICVEGVEIPRPHQLPEELKDLSSRDGDILDPGGEDFEPRLARLLSDLEKVLETTRREKEEAALKQAAEREAKEKAAAEEREAKRAAAAELAAQEAARAKAAAAERSAAQAAEVQKKAEPEPQKARETPASRSGPNPLPAVPSRSTTVSGPSVAPQGSALVIVPSRPTSPPAANSAIVTTSAAKDYLLSGLWTVAGVILSLLVSFALAFTWSFSPLSMYFGNLILAMGYGWLSGGATGFILNLCGVPTGIAALVGLAAGFGAVYLGWAARVYRYLGLFKTTGLVGLFDLVSSPAHLWHFVCVINKTESWDLWGYKLTGVVVWLLWSLEAALIAGFSIRNSSASYEGRNIKL